MPPTDPPRRLQFSLRSLLALVTGAALLCAAGQYWGFPEVIRATAVLSVFGCIIWQFSRPGPKRDAQISIGAAALFHILVGFSTAYFFDYIATFAKVILYASEIVLFVVWVAFAVIAIRTWQKPNRSLGFLSLLLLLSPASLALLAYWHYLLREFFGVEWYGYRFFKWAIDLLWI